MQVPFVDVLTTMCDVTLPLTPPEWPEWGNPIEDKAAYEYIRSYSPYDCLEPRASYPNVLATGGLADPRVTYWYRPSTKPPRRSCWSPDWRGYAATRVCACMLACGVLVPPPPRICASTHTHQAVSLCTTRVTLLVAAPVRPWLV